MIGKNYLNHSRRCEKFKNIRPVYYLYIEGKCLHLHVIKDAFLIITMLVCRQRELSSELIYASLMQRWFIQELLID